MQYYDLDAANQRLRDRDVLVVDEVPDHHAVLTDRWVVYPYKAGK